jgi:hypothetical protein
VKNSKTIPLSIIKTTRGMQIQQVGNSPPERKNCHFLWEKENLEFGSKEHNSKLDMYNDTESRRENVKRRDDNVLTKH